ncbi:DUF3347 domain-containing protein [Lacibacter sp. MH-610]|uniref:DUF3347 domain-containing protein n=1 Tax=Lacibacter sp. MH-610 TaxID=3020883 RepID=UPI003891C73A
MKSIFLALTVFFTGSAKAQNKSLSDLLTHYYHLKNELVAGNQQQAAAIAVQFKNAAAAVSIKQLNAAELKTFEPLQQSLIDAAGIIASAGDINKQRDAFISLSNAMIVLARGIKLTDKEVYVDYCPMKKASWLSGEKAIKNPYYGNSMLTCGSVKETINP